MTAHWFSAEGGFQFKRIGEDVAIRIARDDGTTIDAVVIPANIWCSVITHVSADSNQYANAERFHAATDALEEAGG